MEERLRHWIKNKKGNFYLTIQIFFSRNRDFFSQNCQI